MAWRACLLLLLLCSVIQAGRQHVYRRDVSGGTSAVHWSGSIDSSSTGIIISPNWPAPYPNDASVQWTIQAPQNQNIKLSIWDFILQGGHACPYDYLSIHNGTSTSSPVLTRLCGYVPPRYQLWASNSILLVFRSDGVYTTSGFRIRYEFVDTSAPTYPTWTYPTRTYPTRTYPTSEQLTTSPTTSGCEPVLTPPGVITSPGYPGNYVDNVYRCWTITAPTRQMIKVTFRSFSLEPHRSCSYDSLTIYNGPNTNSPLLAKRCGYSLPGPVISSSNSMRVVFRSDGSVVASGFRLEVSFGTNFTTPGSHIDHTTVPTSSPSLGSTTHSPSSTTSGHHTGGCEHVLTPPGVITFPGHPGNYENNVDRCWMITAPTRQIIKVTFTSFDLEEHTFCLYDSLTIRNGPNTYSPLLMKRCGNNLPGPVVSSSNSMRVVFRSDGSVVASGFRLEVSFGTNFTTPGSHIDHTTASTTPTNVTLPR